MGFILIPEILDRRKDRVGRALAKTTQRCVLHGVADPLQQFNVSFSSSAFTDIRQDLQHPPQAFPAGRTLAAALLTEEIRIIPGHFHHTASVIHNDHTAGSHHSAVLCQRIKIHLQIQHALRNTAAGRTACLDRLKRPVPDDPAADIKDQMPERCSHGHFHKAGSFYLSYQGKYLGPCTRLCTDFGKFLSSVPDDQRNIRQCFYIIQNGRLVPESFLDRTDILCPGFSYPSLDRCHKGRGFSADKGSSSADHRQMQPFW